MALFEKRYADAIFNASAVFELLLKDYLTRRGIKPSPVFSYMVEIIKEERKVPRVVLDQIVKLRTIKESFPSQD